ncbi:hypothetical protein GCM10007291_07350 [Gemmobacter nanjingensis]|uniref:Uncharacterized protein n=1 Tax=Gemmobacter nanjingensis TaxID=488454 RepID=A0ABQ3F7X9_9RHOB|nr:hypothetical protein [Gemmobacter nanjingensis]GHC12610.1 hypothetical protein GCM10007291_07350 [Gemmobacter nanjingensis]
MIMRSNGFDHVRDRIDRLVEAGSGLTSQQIAPHLWDEADVRRRVEAARAFAARTGAPMAAARDPMQLVENWIVERGGTRRRDGSHWRDMCQLEVMVAQAAQRHLDKGLDPAAFVAPFTPGQIAVARDYRALVEWRNGSAMKCASLEAGRGSGQGGLFIDTFIGQGDWLADLRHRVGDVVILDIRRQMDRGNARRKVTALAALDAVVIEGLDLSAVLARYRWAVKGQTRATLRAGLRAALDRMQGYREKGD